MRKEQLKTILTDTIKMVDTKDEIIRKHALTIADLTDLAEFWEALSDKRREQLVIANDFIQYILNKWEVETKEIQDKALETLRKMNSVKIKTKNF